MKKLFQESEAYNFSLDTNIVSTTEVTKLNFGEFITKVPKKCQKVALLPEHDQMHFQYILLMVICRGCPCWWILGEIFDPGIEHSPAQGRPGTNC